MSGLAAYNKKILFRAHSTAASTSGYNEAPGTTFTLNVPKTLLDDTDFTSTGYMSRLPGLKDYNITGTIHFGATGAVFTAIRDAWLNDTKLDFRYLPDGTNGFQGTVHVESMGFTGDVASLETVDVNMSAEGTALSTI